MREPRYARAPKSPPPAAGRGFEAAAEGLWLAGELAGLARNCVAIVGTRAATPYGRGLAAAFRGAIWGSAGCCIISGLALGIDARGARGRARAPGADDRRPRRRPPALLPAPQPRAWRNAWSPAGGAVLSPYPPDQETRPHQFLARNGIVAALADAVVVIEAPARSGALNTAGWAAGRFRSLPCRATSIAPTSPAAWR